MPEWLRPVTPVTIAIVALPVVLVCLVVDSFVTHWREDRRDEQRERDQGGD